MRGVGGGMNGGAVDTAGMTVLGEGGGREGGGRCSDRTRVGAAGGGGKTLRWPGLRQGSDRRWRIQRWRNVVFIPLDVREKLAAAEETMLGENLVAAQHPVRQ